ncbi:MAG: thioredoxin domain-containing protein, partial [Balneolaceae bacterium]|nr:thioredoxin domain-containing protein [Balneolaceae bacterium]
MKSFNAFLILVFVIALAAPSGVYSQTTDDEAKVVLVEYSDYQCPACGYFHPILESLKKEYGDDLKVIQRHFPLNQHQYAALAARA